ncbi:MAG: NADP-dependent phosphogluconate dehydrogenase [Cyclobacteriaceae bacterium]
MDNNNHDFGLIGLGVMGRNFILNVADNGFSASGLDLDAEKVEALHDEGSGKQIFGTQKIEEFVASLKTPRVIMMLVPAGKPVDNVIEDLLPHVEKGDIIIDGGNSHFDDTDRRFDYLKSNGINFLGIGVSGGAKGARLGPSMMPGGEKNIYDHISSIFEAVAAKVNGEPCVTYLGPKSAGNYVKMVHNGIEYALMQLIAESYDFLKSSGLTNDELADVFTNWNNGRLASFLVEITAEIFQKKDDLTDGHLVDAILDKAKQKGTGKWTSQHAMNLGIPIPAIDMAVTMRGLSSQKENRMNADLAYGRGISSTGLSKPEAIELAESALYFSYITSYAQGLVLLMAASEEKNYNLNPADISKIWRGGCIIRAGLLEKIRQAYAENSSLKNLLLAPNFVTEVQGTLSSTRKFISTGVQHGIPLPAHAACLSYFDAFTSGRLPINLVQAQRDHFGSHTYERVDREGIFHTEW